MKLATSLKIWGFLKKKMYTLDKFFFSLSLHNRNKHERAAHVLWGKCTQALARRHLPVVSCFHGVRGRAGTGGRAQVHATQRDDLAQSLHVDLSSQAYTIRRRDGTSTVTLWMIYL